MRVFIALLLIVPSVTMAQTFNGKTAKEWAALLESDDVKVRDEGTYALVQMGDRSTRVLMTCLGDSRTEVRYHAIMALYHLGRVAKVAATGLAEVAKDDPDVEIRGFAEAAWVRIQVDASRLESLMKEIDSSNWGVRLAAVEVLGELGKEAAAAAPRLASLMSEEGAALDEFMQSPGSDGNHNIRRSAARSLAAIGSVPGTDSVAALRRGLSHSGWPVREESARALAAFGAEASAAIPDLLRLLDDDSWSVRYTAVEAVTAVLDERDKQLPTVVAVMARALDDSDSGVRRLAGELLLGLGEQAKAAIPAVVTSLESTLLNDVKRAALILREVGDGSESVIDGLLTTYRRLIQDSEPDPYDSRKSTIDEILATLARLAPELRKTMPSVDEVLKEMERPTLSEGEIAKAEINEARQALVSGGLDKKCRAVMILAGRLGDESVPELMPFLDEKHPPALRAVTVDVLRRMDVEAIVPRVRPMLDSSDPQLQEVAAIALVMFDDRKSRARVVAFFRERMTSATSPDDFMIFGMTGLEELVPTLIKVLDERDAFARHFGSLRAIAHIGAAPVADKLAAYILKMERRDDIKAGSRQELISIGLSALGNTAAPEYRKLFEKLAKSDEIEIRDAAVAALARLGEKKALAELAERKPWLASHEPLPRKIIDKLSSVRLRISQVNGHTLEDVLERITKKLDVPISVAKEATPALEGKFYWYIEYIGLRPTAGAILASIQPMMFDKDIALVATFEAGKLVLVPNQ